MSTIQRIILISSGIVLIIGTIIILVSNNLNLVELLGFYLAISVPTALFFIAFSKPNKNQQEFVPSTKTSTAAEVPPVDLNSKTMQIPVEKSGDNKTVKSVKEQADKYMRKEPLIMNERKDIFIQQMTLEHPEQANQTLITVKASSFFELFPNTVIIEEKSISIIQKSFFRLAQVETIPIMDIASVRLYTGPIFAALGIKIKSTPREIEIRHLSKHDALKAKQTLDGLILVGEKAIDVPQNLPVQQKQELISRAGSTPAVEKEVSS